MVRSVLEEGLVSAMSSTVTRQGRKTCIHCRKSLGNGEPLTEATITVDERWGRNSVGFTRVPVAPHEELVAAHAECQRESERWLRANRARYAREQMAELDEVIAERRGRGGDTTRLEETHARWADELAELETE